MFWVGLGRRRNVLDYKGGKWTEKHEGRSLARRRFSRVEGRGMRGRKGREKKKVGGKRWKEKRQRRHTKEARLAWRPRVPTDSH